ncbi:MAG TPA: hypothetical protein VGC42_00900 [Kofleriaceae bacterium]
MSVRWPTRIWLLAALLAGCRDVPGLADAPAASVDARSDAAAVSDDGDGPIQRRGCTSTFGHGLSPSVTFGRLDGYLVAIVPPQSSARGCNSDLGHVHLQVLMQSEVYDVAVNVGDDVHTVALDRAPFSAWSEGWHTGSDIFVEYTGLGLHAETIPASTKVDTVNAIEAELANTNRITIYASSYGPDGAHLVHRNGAGNDGLIVSKPLSGTAHMRAFSFDTDSF